MYAEGWQTWSPMRLYRSGETTPPAPDHQTQVGLLRPDKPIPQGVIQAEGVLAIAWPDGRARAWFAPEPAQEVPTLRLIARGVRYELMADGRVDEVQGTSLDDVLTSVADRLAHGQLQQISPGWCSWYHYFPRVTERDVLENADAARQLDLPIEIIQVDDGYEAAIGDWLRVRPDFGSLERLSQRIRTMGMRAGIWTAPFMVSPSSELAARHPDWLLANADAGVHWGQRMRILDISNDGASDYLTRVFQTFAGWGFTYFKLDFLFAAAIPGIDRYRQGLQLIRRAVGQDAIVLNCGAPLLPSIGLCDAMRIGPDVLLEVSNPQIDIDVMVQTSALRSWMTGRLWINDPDCLVVRSEIKDREAWASHLETYGGVRFSSDRLSGLDARGVELTRRFLRQPQR